MTEPQTPPPDPPEGPPPPPAPPARPLLRRDHDKRIAGVAGGVADYLGLDATVVRAAFVVLLFFGGTGLPLYLVGWAVLPSPSRPQSHAEVWFGRGNRGTVAVVALVAVLLIAVGNDHPGSDGVLWGLALVFIGWVLFRADRRITAGVAGAPTAGGVGAPPGHSTWHGRGGTDPTVVGPPVASMPPPDALPRHVPPPRPPRDRSMLGRITIGAGLTVLGAAALLDQIRAVPVDPAQYAGLALTVTGLGLVVGAWVGRAYRLIPIGLLLVPILLLTSIDPLPLDSGVGQLGYAPQDLDEVEESYSLGIGQMDLDLSSVTFTEAPTTVTISVGVGDTTVIVPDEATVSLSGQMRAGEMRLFELVTVGRPFVDPIGVTDEGKKGGGRLQLEINNGVGQLTVRRETGGF